MMADTDTWSLEIDADRIAWLTCDTAGHLDQRAVRAGAARSCRRSWPRSPTCAPPVS